MPDEEESSAGKYLTFSLGEEVYAVPIRAVTEIVGMQPVASVPDAPACVLGLISRREKVLPLVDLRARFRLPPAQTTDRSCIVVVETGALAAGLLVDAVEEVASLPDDAVLPPPDFQGGAGSCVCGIGKAGAGILLILDCKRLFEGAELETLRQLDQ